MRDGAAAFVGSQSLRKLELDGRREVGIIITNTRVARGIQAVFEADWARSGGAKATGRARTRLPAAERQVAAAG